MSAVRDPGLAAERTRLAWHRTALAMAVCATLALREAIQTGDRLPLFAGVLLGGSAAAMFWLGYVREQQLATETARAPAARFIHVVWCCPVLAALSFILTLLTNLS